MDFAHIETRARAARASGQEIVLVLGLGFVGTAVAGNLARAEKNGARLFFVIGLDRDDAAGRAKVARLDAGSSPTYANDPSLEHVIHEACTSAQNLLGTNDPRAIGLADVVVSCINLDVQREPGQTESLVVPTEGYAAAMRMVGEHMRPGTLVTVESTLPFGLCDRVLYPALCDGQRKRGVDVSAKPPKLAYCYERVMPGPDYLDSVNNFWRAYAGIDEASADAARDFLAKYVNVEKFPLWRHKSTRAAEMAKLLENSYRATNIAFIEEWSKLAEGAGVDLFDVIKSVRVRRGTHDNMMLPGLGVGGYCLTKDALLAAYGAERLIGIPAEMPFSRRAILTNERMPLRAVQWVEEHCAGALAGKRVALIGVTYRPGVNDTRSTPSEIVARALAQRGARVVAYDPLVTHWDEVPEISVSQDPQSIVRGADVVVICLPDPLYRPFLADLLKAEMKSGTLVVDPWNMVVDACAAEFAKRGVQLRVYGRGDYPTASARPVKT
ncbi:MAG: nucleotide sugar dehydrogenase [Planctomycetes bacterium]|nr:nucleotide sugar dehydrogenase [Planctomycetota bacterium]